MRDQTKRRKMSLTNTVKSGIFSADYTVMKYAEDIWQIAPVNLHKEKRN
ncbi:glycogen/starch/alpha-glucan phosphorylase [Enterococcus cecorum]